MQRYTKLEISVGAFVVVGSMALGYLALTLGDLSLSRRHNTLHTRFSNVGELKVGAPVKLAGVTLGEVKTIQLVNYAAEVELAIDDSLKLPDDTIASIQNAGLLGDSYVALSAGASDHNLAPGSRITHTEPATNLMDLIEKYAFGSPLADDKPSTSAASAKDGQSNSRTPHELD
ncbi:MAG: hypothetical protein RL701_4775 [Pseudomonadota bacterium]|jgi:phospholipid/cholesterol/gamma-HCH transport system substrate-binding protein